MGPRCPIPLDPADPDTHYVVTFRSPDDGAVTALKVRRVSDSDLGVSFVCLSEFLFDTGSRLANPTEEALARKFAGTRRLHLNLYTIQSIAEVGADHPGLFVGGPHPGLFVGGPHPGLFVGGPHPGLDLDVDRANVVVLPPPLDRG